jgi:hypothetical protein
VNPDLGVATCQNLEDLSSLASASSYSSSSASSKPNEQSSTQVSYAQLLIFFEKKLIFFTTISM